MKFNKAVHSYFSYSRIGVRYLFIAMMVVMLVVPAVAQVNNTSLNISVQSVSVTVEPHSPFYIVVSGTYLLSNTSDTYTGQYVINGTALVTLSNGQEYNIVLGSSPPGNIESYPSTPSSSFGGTKSGASGTVTNDAITLNVYSWSGSVSSERFLGTTSVSGLVSNAQPSLYTLIVELPLFNDTMLGSSTSPTDPQLPIGALYNFMLILGILVLAISLLFTMLKSNNQGTGGVSFAMANVMIAIVVIVAFPILWNAIAAGVNYVTQTLIAYPNPYTMYAQSLNNIWYSTLAANTTTWWASLFLPLFEVAYAIMLLITYIMIYLLGTSRLFLLGAFIAAFPLVMALNEIPFTQKLGQLAMDTLEGLVMASIMSAIVLAVASTILANYSAPTNIFVQGGVLSNWVAVAAILIAVLMPTILAPTVGWAFQTISQTGMMAAGVAGTAAMGAVAPVAGALPGMFSAGMSASGGLGGGLKAAGQAFLSSGAHKQVLSNMGVALGGGVAGALGVPMAGIMVQHHLGTAQGINARISANNEGNSVATRIQASYDNLPVSGVMTDTLYGYGQELLPLLEEMAAPNSGNVGPRMKKAGIDISPEGIDAFINNPITKNFSEKARVNRDIIMNPAESIANRNAAAADDSRTIRENS